MGCKRGRLKIENRGKNITNWDRDFKFGERDFKSGQRFQIGAEHRDKYHTLLIYLSY